MASFGDTLLLPEGYGEKTERPEGDGKGQTQVPGPQDGTELDWVGLSRGTPRSSCSDPKAVTERMEPSSQWC